MYKITTSNENVETYQTIYAFSYSMIALELVLILIFTVGLITMVTTW